MSRVDSLAPFDPHGYFIHFSEHRVQPAWVLLPAQTKLDWANQPTYAEHGGLTVASEQPLELSPGCRNINSEEDDTRRICRI